MESTEILSDLIKIGIPSIVALGGTISTLLLAQWGHRQNTRIAKLQHYHNKEAERNSRTGELAKVCAAEISRLHKEFINFCIIFSAKIDTLTCNDPWDEAEQSLMTERYQQALLALSGHTSISSYTMLLGSEELIRAHSMYLSLVSVIINAYTQSDEIDIDTFNKTINESNAWHAKLTTLVSDIYLLK